MEDEALSPEELATRRIEGVRETRERWLDLSRLKLKQLPISLKRLTHLHFLSIAGNSLSELPGWIADLVNLRELYINNNELPSLPKELWTLTNLRKLVVNDNKLSLISEQIGRLVELRTLKVSHNRLTTLPPGTGLLRQLEYLDASHNQLRELPRGWEGLLSLEALFLLGNRLAVLPAAICNLSGLISLSMGYNDLVSLPDAISQLRQLQRLDLSYNQLAVIPDSLQNLKGLQQLFLHGNDRLGLPAEVLGPGLADVQRKNAIPTRPAQILEYYFRLRGGTKPLNEAKLILVGRGGVGKTSIVNRLVYKSFDKAEPKTDGINITNWKLRLSTREDVRLHIWDFGGQEIMHATHQFFLTQRSIYLLVVSGREGGEDSDAEYWLKLIDSFGAGSPAIVVLNKFKEQPFNLNRRALLQKYPFVRCFVETDCLDGSGIGDLHSAVERETGLLEHLRDAFPSAWFKIKDRIAEMRDNYLTFDKYREICSSNGEKDMAAQDSLAAYLHSLGIALNYKDDPRLRDTHLLNPRWVTNGIYKILNARRLAEQHGVVLVSDVREIARP